MSGAGIFAEWNEKSYRVGIGYWLETSTRLQGKENVFVPQKSVSLPLMGIFFCYHCGFVPINIPFWIGHLSLSLSFFLVLLCKPNPFTIINFCVSLFANCICQFADARYLLDQGILLWVEQVLIFMSNIIYLFILYHSDVTIRYVPRCPLLYNFSFTSKRSNHS